MLIIYHFDLVLTLTILVQQGLLSSAVPNRVVKTHRARVTPEDATESCCNSPGLCHVCMYVHGAQLQPHLSFKLETPNNKSRFRFAAEMGRPTNLT